MNINRKHFVDYMYDISSNNNYVSDFENNISGIELRQKELNDVQTTVNNFKQILNEK